MNFEEFEKYNPIKTTGWTSHEESETKSLYEIEGKFFVVEAGYCVFSRDSNNDIEITEISYEDAVLFLDNDDDEFID